MLLSQLREAEPAPLLRHDPLDELLEAGDRREGVLDDAHEVVVVGTQSQIRER